MRLLRSWVTRVSVRNGLSESGREILVIEQILLSPVWIMAVLKWSPSGHMAVVVASLLLLILFCYFAYRFARVGVQLRTADQYRLTAEASGGVCFEYCIETRVIHWVDRERLKLLGFSTTSDLQIADSSDKVHPDDQAALEKSWARFAEGSKTDLQVRLRTMAETWAWFSLSAIPIKGRKGSYTKAIGVLRSTDALHEIQEKIAEDRRIETLGTIAGGIAHEFNNHLTPVRGFIELALDDLPEDHPSYEGLETALDRVLHCSELVSQIQAYGRKSLIMLRAMDLSDVLNEAVKTAMANNQGPANSVVLKQAWPETLPKTQVDATQFNQAIGHLIRNSFEAMPHGGQLTVRAIEKWIDEDDCIGKREAIPGHFVVVSIEDTGSGIAREHLDRVMDPFYTTHGRARARGMGLSMVHGMMAQHGGWMDIVTAPKSGTKIMLYYPVDEAQTTRDNTHASVQPYEFDALANKEGGKVLAADDEVFIRTLVRTMFESKAWEVSEAEDHDEVIAAFNGSEALGYDLVVLDLTMPGATAEEAVQTIRSTSPDTKILISSGKHHDQRVESMMKEPGVDFIAKPYSPKELMAKVDDMLPLTMSRSE